MVNDRIKHLALEFGELESTVGLPNRAQNETEDEYLNHLLKGFVFYLKNPKLFESMGFAATRGWDYITRDPSGAIHGDVKLFKENQQAFAAEDRTKLQNGLDEIVKEIKTESKTKTPKQPQVKHVYLMKNKRNGAIKIGWSHAPGKRESTLQSEEPEIEMIAYWKGTALDERLLHVKYQEKRLRGEWFRLTEEDVKAICEAHLTI